AAGDINGDHHADIITGAGVGGGPHVKVIDGATGAVIDSFMAFNPNYFGGVDVAVGDLAGNGQQDIIVGQMTGASAQVRIFNAANLNVLTTFTPFATSLHSFGRPRLLFTGQFADGVRVATAEASGSGQDDLIVAAGANFPSHVRVYHGNLLTLLGDFEPFDPSFLGGVSVG